jgi:hypothetical protein
MGTGMIRNIILVLISIAFGVCRIVGFKSTFFQGIAHVWVGLLFGAWLGSWFLLWILRDYKKELENAKMIFVLDQTIDLIVDFQIAPACLAVFLTVVEIICAVTMGVGT